MRRLIDGLLGAALAGLLAAAPGQVLPLQGGAGVRAGAIGAPARAVRRAELRVASERTLRAPQQKAARTRRPSTSSGSGLLLAPLPAGAVGTPVVFSMRVACTLVSLRSECGHCTRAPRPPPIS
jgi:hypothetical protein